MTDHILQFDKFKQWQRVKPIGVLYFADKFLRGVFSNFIVLIPMFIAIRSGFEQNPTLGGALLIAFVTLFIGFVLASYYAFQFRISDGRIEIRKGILQRLRLNVPFDKVQEIKLVQPVYYRTSHMTVVLLDTAGSNKQEATLVALPLEDAEALKHIVQCSRQASPRNTTERMADTANNASLLISRSLSDIVIHGITNNRVWIILSALTPFADDAIARIDDWLSFLNLTEFYSIEQQGLLVFSTVLFSTIIIVTTLVMGFSVLGAIFRFYGYELHRSKDGLQQQSGLVTRYQVNVKMTRIQHIIYKQDWLDSLFGRINLAFKQMSAQNSGAETQLRTLIVPSVTQQQGFQLGGIAFPHNDPFALNFTPISKRFIFRNCMLIVIPVTAFVVGMLMLAISDGASLMLLWWLLAPLLLVCLIILRWYRWGYYYDDNYLYIQKGLFGVDKSVYPLFKVQQSAFKQSAMLRRLGIANVELSYASALASVPFIAESDAVKLINQPLLNAESSCQSWM